MSRFTHRRSLVMFLAVALVAMSASTTSLAGTAVFQGKVLAEDGVTPVEGVVVRLGMQDTGAIYDAAPTNGNGVFRLDAVPSGTYAIMAQRDGVGFLAADDLELSDGENPAVAILIRSGAEIAPSQTTVSELPGWGKGVIGGAIAVIIYVAFDDTTEEGVDSETPF